MHAEHVVKADGQYQIIARAGEPDYRLYRNRVRLLVSPNGIWTGPLETDDLLELEGEDPLSLQVMPIDQGYGNKAVDPHPGNHPPGAGAAA